MKSVLLWVLQIAVALFFLAAGWPKLVGAPPMVQAFEAIGFGQWFRYLTGVLEMGGAVLLFVPALAGFGALTLAIVMIGATFAHMVVLGGSAAIPLALLAATSTIGWLRREQFGSLIRV